MFLAVSYMTRLHWMVETELELNSRARESGRTTDTRTG